MATMRNELKFYISPADHRILLSRLSALLPPDENMRGKAYYTVRSLYFDDPASSAYFDKIYGTEKRAKYRIRFYNEDLSYLRLEKKEKIGKMTRKTVEKITQDEARSLLSQNVDSFSSSGLLGEIKRKIHFEAFRPLLFVDYRRSAFCYPAGNVRITLDTSLKGNRFRGELMDDFALHSVPTATDFILEIKFDSFLPGHIAELFSDIPKVSSAISKFCLVREYLFKE